MRQKLFYRLTFSMVDLPSLKSDDYFDTETIFPHKKYKDFVCILVWI